MPTNIIMPQLGESIAEGTIVKWLIAPGDRVEKDQSLLEVETDKVALEIPSPAAGFLTEVLVQEGQTVPVGELLGQLEAEQSAAAKEVVSRVGGVIVKTAPSGEGRYSPAVRQLAQEHGVDLSQVAGSGAAGRVTKKDLLEFIAAGGSSVQPSAVDRTAAAAPIGAEEKILPFTAMRKTIAERMVKSRQTSAHVVTFFEVDMSNVAKTRVERKLTYLPFVVSAVTRAIIKMPALNSSWGEAGIVLKRDVHMGIAVAIDEGLLVPVLRDADKKSVTKLAAEVADLANRARTKQLHPEEVQGGTFTITNHGGYGSLCSTPIIHQPQIAILGVGSVQKRAVVVNDAIAIRPMCYLSLAFDHRVIDGATADLFMAEVKRNLESSDWEKYL